MATSGSPEKETANSPSALVRDRPLGDFGYSAGAALINGRFATQLADARRRLSRHELPFAVRALRDTRAKELGALREHCARKRRDWYLADRELLARHRVPRPDRPRITPRSRTFTPN